VAVYNKKTESTVCVGHRKRKRRPGTPGSLPGKSERAPKKGVAATEKGGQLQKIEPKTQKIIEPGNGDFCTHSRRRTTETRKKKGFRAQGGIRERANIPGTTPQKKKAVGKSDGGGKEPRKGNGTYSPTAKEVP